MRGGIRGAKEVEEAKNSIVKWGGWKGDERKKEMIRVKGRREKERKK